MERILGNRALISTIVGTKAREYDLVGIDARIDCPSCDLNKKKIYTPIFPPVVDAHDDAMVRGYQVHEAGHARFTPIHPDQKSWGRTKFSIINSLEDARIERALAEMNISFEEALLAVNCEAGDKLATIDWTQIGPVDEAIMAMHLTDMNYPVKWQVSPQANDLIRIAYPVFKRGAVLKASTNKRENEKSFEQVVKIADEIMDLWKQFIKNDPQQQGQGDGQQSDPQDGQDGQGGQGGQSGQGGQQQSSSQAGDSQDGQDGQQDGQQSSQAGDKGDDKGKQSQAGDGKDGKDGKQNGGANAKTDIEDASSGRDLLHEAVADSIKEIAKKAGDDFGHYLPYEENDCVFVPPQDPNRFEHYSRQADKIAGRLISDFDDTLRSISRCHRKHGTTYGDISDHCLVDIAKSLSDRIFTRKIKGEDLSNTVVSLLIDESGSMTGYRLPNAIVMAVAFAEALDNLGMRFEVLGHNCKGLSRKGKPSDLLQNGYTRVDILEMRVYKSFEENWQSVKERLGSCELLDHCNTADADGLNFTCLRNLDEKADRHVVFSLSDGSPCLPHGCCGSENLDAVIKCYREKGVEIKAIALGTYAPARYYGDENTVMVDNCDNLTEEFFTLLNDTLLKGGDDE